MNIATRTTYHHGNLGPALIAAARQLLDTDGPGAVSLREAARRVGVSATATYRHFTDKDHLLAAVAAEGYREFADKLRAVDVDGDGFSHMGVAYIEFALDHPGLFRLMFGPLLRERERFPDLGAAADERFRRADGERAQIYRRRGRRRRIRSPTPRGRSRTGSPG